MKTLFFTLSIISSCILMVVLTVLALTNQKELIRLNWNFIGIVGLIHAVLWTINLFTLWSYFNNRLWKTESELQSLLTDVSKKDRKLTEMIDKIGRHEALKQLNDN